MKAKKFDSEKEAKKLIDSCKKDYNTKYWARTARDNGRLYREEDCIRIAIKIVINLKKFLNKIPLQHFDNAKVSKRNELVEIHKSLNKKLKENLKEQIINPIDC